MAMRAGHRVVHKVGTIDNWIKQIDLRDKRIRLLDVSGEVRRVSFNQLHIEHFENKAEFEGLWWVCNDCVPTQAVGRAAAVIAKVLQGKDKPTYNPTLEEGDVVVVVNADKAELTGNKLTNKVYYRHSGVPGNLHMSTPEEAIAKFGRAEVLWRAVDGMLPKNTLRKRRLKKLVIYNGAEHDFNEEYMFRMTMPPRNVKPSKVRWDLPEGYHPMNAAAYFRAWKGADADWERKAQEVLRREADETANAPPVQESFKAEREGFRIQ